VQPAAVIRQLCAFQVSDLCMLCDLRRPFTSHHCIISNRYIWHLLQVTVQFPHHALSSAHSLAALRNMQVTALQNGNSFNTMFTQNSQVQTVSVKRTSTYITVEGFFSNANVTSTGTQACGVWVAVLSYCCTCVTVYVTALRECWLLFIMCGCCLLCYKNAPVQKVTTCAHWHVCFCIFALSMQQCCQL
jgi:hypothetical protein